jgi:hypothetical protein
MRIKRFITAFKTLPYDEYFFNRAAIRRSILAKFFVLGYIAAD